MIKQFFIAAFATLALASASQAQTIYECKMTSVASSGWVSELMYFQVDEKEKTALAYDYYIDKAYDKPISVKFARNGANIMKFNWEVRGIKSSNRNRDVGRVAYRAQINKSTGKIRVRVTLVSYDNSSGGNGTCTRKK